jgi:hypothetical protein
MLPSVIILLDNKKINDIIEKQYKTYSGDSFSAIGWWLKMW